jgi:tripartite-type tricarboxylate transporter receptor subunit TctC
LADRLDAMFLVNPPIKQHVQDGKLVALATLNATRVDALPGIPTMKELGRPEMTSAIWFGYLAPAKTPDPIMARLVQAFQALKSDRALGNRVTEMGAELSLTGPAEFGRIIDDDRRRYGRLVAEGKLDKQN